MPYLGRALTPDKWDAAPELGSDEVSADLLTQGKSDVRTHENKLSFYESEDSEIEAVQRTALALAAGRRTLDPIFVACLDRAALEGESISIEHTSGNTQVRDLNPLHRDAVRLDAFRLARIAVRLAAAVRGNTFHTWTREGVRALLQEAVDNRRVNLAQLNPDLRQELHEPSS